MQFSILLAVVTVFPVAVTIALKGKYTLVVVMGAVLNLVAYGVALKQQHDITPALLAVYSGCLIVAAILWYLAFKRRSVAGTDKTGRVLTRTGWAIAIAAVLFVAGFFAMIFWYISQLTHINGQ